MTWQVLNPYDQECIGSVELVDWPQIDRWLDEARALSQGGSVWLGLNDEKEEGEWVWSDGSPMDYNNWKHGDPNSFDPDFFSIRGVDCGSYCAKTPNDKIWCDRSCNQRYPFICRHSPITSLRRMRTRRASIGHVMAVAVSAAMAPAAMAARCSTPAPSPSSTALAPPSRRCG